MHKRQLGKHGPMVSAIGVGCWSFAGSYGPTTEAESHDTLSAALELGIDFLDTANVYGNGISENVIGSYVKHHPGRFTIATKVGIYRNPETNVRGFNNSPKHLRSALENSLRNLKVDHVALYYIHRREADRPIEDVMDTLVRFREEGKIGGIGFSEIAPSSLRRAHAVHPVMAVQSEYSLWTRGPELGMIQACSELGVAFVPFSPLGRGIFARNLPEPSKFEKGDFRNGNPRFVEPSFSHNVRALEPFRAWCEKRTVSPASVAIAWCLAQGPHLLPVPGTRSRAHLEELAAGTELKLTRSDLAEIAKCLPPGFAHGDRYTQAQWPGAERYF